MEHGVVTFNLLREIWNKEEDIPKALKLACLYHDIDREDSEPVNTKDCRFEDYPARKLLHSFNSALIFKKKHCRILTLSKAEKQDAIYLIVRHEIGGDRGKDGKLLIKKDSTNLFNLNELADFLYWADKMTFFDFEFFKYANRGEERLYYKIKFSMKDLPKFVLDIILSKDYGEYNELVKKAYGEV